MPNPNAEGRMHPMVLKAKYARDAEGLAPTISKLVNWDQAN